MRILEGIDSKSQKDPATIVVQSTIEATMMIEYIALDLYAAYRQYLSATTDYEERQAMTKANIVMSEGYKKLTSIYFNVPTNTSDVLIQI